jgi:hypothetical protein
VGDKAAMKRTFTTTLIIMSFSTTAVAECSKSAVGEVLSRNGYTHEYRGERNGGDSNAFSITKDGGTFLLMADTDGDLAFRKYFSNSLGLTNDDTARVMERYKYLQVYIDSDGDVAMAYDVALWGEKRCNYDLNSELRFFINLVESAEDALVND